MPTYRSFNHASHLEDPEQPAEALNPHNSRQTWEYYHLDFILSQRHRPLHASWAQWPRKVPTRKDVTADACQMSRMHKMELQCSCSRLCHCGKYCILRTRCGCCCRVFGGDLCYSLVCNSSKLLHTQRNEIWEVTLEVLKLCTTLSFSVKVMPFNWP